MLGDIKGAEKEAWVEFRECVWACIKHMEEFIRRKWEKKGWDRGVLELKKKKKELF